MWRGYGEISVGYYRQLETSETGMATSDVRSVEGNFVVKLHAQKVDSHFLNIQLPLNENDNNLE